VIAVAIPVANYPAAGGNSRYLGGHQELADNIGAGKVERAVRNHTLMQEEIANGRLVAFGDVWRMQGDVVGGLGPAPHATLLDEQDLVKLVAQPDGFRIRQPFSHDSHVVPVAVLRERDLVPGRFMPIHAHPVQHAVEAAVGRIRLGDVATARVRHGRPTGRINSFSGEGFHHCSLRAPV